MRTRFSSLLIIGSLLCLPLGAVASPKEDAVIQSLRQLYPKIPVQAIAQTPISGLWEVIDGKDNIFYFFPESGHVISGEMWSKEGQNLSKARYTQLMSLKYSDIPLEKGLKIGNGPNVVVEVTDPDCPYCRKGAAYWKTRTDVTRYVFFTPLDKIHPEANRKSRYILSAKDPAKAYDEVMSGQFDGKPLPAFTDNGLLDEQVAIGRKLRTRGTPNYWVNGNFVSGGNHKKLEQYLTKK